MKKIFKLLFISVLIIFITNCSKKDTGPDLTTNIVGIYTGTIEVTDAALSYDQTYTNQQVQITKISNSEVQIQPYNNGGGSSFTANLSQSGNTIILTVPVETITGGSIQALAGDTSKYNTSTKQFNYAIKDVQNGVYVADELFTGVKQ